MLKVGPLASWYLGGPAEPPILKKCRLYMNYAFEMCYYLFEENKIIWSLKAEKARKYIDGFLRTPQPHWMVCLALKFKDKCLS